MNKILFFVAVILIVSLTFSCRSTKKGCKGKGSWYGHRNLATQTDTILTDSINNINTYAICKLH